MPTAMASGRAGDRAAVPARRGLSVHRRRRGARPYGHGAVPPAACGPDEGRLPPGAGPVPRGRADPPGAGGAGWGTKVKANAALDANRTASTIAEQVSRMLAEAEA